MHCWETSGRTLLFATATVACGMQPVLHLVADPAPAAGPPWGGSRLWEFETGAVLAFAGLVVLLRIKVPLAACIAGFSDAAHLGKTFRPALGTTPTGLVPRGRSRFVDKTQAGIRQQETDIPRHGNEFIFAISHKNERRERNAA